MKSDAMGGYAEFSYMETMCIQTKQNRIGLLGGTFNPVHNGHISMAYIALYEFMLGEVLFLPLGTPPHKRFEYIAAPEHRLNMISLAIEGEKRFSIDTIELYRKGYTFTVDTLEALYRANQNVEYYFIIGADTLFELTTWKNHERVFQLTRFICILRPGIHEASVQQYAQKLNGRYGHRIYLAREKGPDISSSLIRQMAVQNRLSGSLVPPKVADYVRRNRLYVKED